MFYHGIKQEDWIEESKADDVGNITGSSKVTRTGRIFSPNISPPTAIMALVRITAEKPNADIRGKKKVVDPAEIEVHAKDIATEERPTQEMDEILKIIKRSDFKIVE